MGRRFSSTRRLPMLQLVSAVVAIALCLYTPGLTLVSSMGFKNNLETIIRPESTVYAQQIIPHSVPRTAPDCYAKPCIALTFDDGPNPTTTPQILQTLEANDVPASFFVVGKNIAGNTQLLRRMHADGDEIGNHSWDHQDFTKLTPEQMVAELTQTQEAMETAGVPAATYFRPPYGATNQQMVDSIPLQIVLWNEDPVDWGKSDPAQIVAAVTAAAKPGGIIDLHDIHPTTAAAVQPIIDALKDQYQFVTVSQLLHSHDRTDRTPFFGYEASLFERH